MNHSSRNGTDGVGERMKNGKRREGEGGKGEGEKAVILGWSRK